MNHLADATSPYLLQHADNPVDWYPWGDDAFSRARAEDKPILLSVGYSACHWCHVMEHESFEDEATARVMNERFVNVKVDREERPDVDALYMDAVVALTGHGGWPMTVFLTPDGEPFYGGTYYPPQPRHGLPAFRDLLVAVSDAYRERRGEVAHQARALVESIGAGSAARPSNDPLTESVLVQAQRALASGFDRTWGGWGRAPKFPPPSTLEFLLRRHHAAGDEQALELVTKTLDGMAAGGMYDVLGGGFHRYSVDERWLVPHFEKMLYDNALLVPVYLHAWLVTGRARYRDVAERTLDYMLRELLLPEGGFASAQDADTDGVEGATFVWTPADLEAVLGPDEGARAAALLGVTPEGSFEHGTSVLRPVDGAEIPEEWRRRLLAARQERSQPARDDKALASWNGLALAAIAEAGRRLERRDLVVAATGVGKFLLAALSDEAGRLRRSYRAGRTTGMGYLDDYANVAHGLLELHVATGDVSWLEESVRLARLAVELFSDEERGGFYLAPADGEQLVARTKGFDDNPIPSGNSMLAYVLLRLARIYGDDDLERRAVSVFRLVRSALARAPSAFGHALSALDLHFSPRRELAIVGPPESEIARAALAAYDPNAVVAFGPSDAVPLLAGKGLVDGRPAVYVCERFACRAPVTEPAELAA